MIWFSKKMFFASFAVWVPSIDWSGFLNCFCRLNYSYEWDSLWPIWLSKKNLYKNQSKNIVATKMKTLLRQIIIYYFVYINDTNCPLWLFLKNTQTNILWGKCGTIQKMICIKFEGMLGVMRPASCFGWRMSWNFSLKQHHQAFFLTIVPCLLLGK